MFTEPQIAAVGLTEEEAQRRGIAVRRRAAGLRRHRRRLGPGGHHRLRQGARRSRAPACCSGAHVIGPEAATVIQPLIQAMSFGQRAHEVARGQYWIHPALTEVVENALLALPKPTGS